MENLQAETEKEIKSDKYQTKALIAVALIIVGVIFIFIALSQPRVSNDKAVNSTIKSSVSDKTAAKTSGNTAYTTNKSSHSVSFPINLNTCTAEDLMAVETIGETRANAIIAYRDYLGGYTSVDQLKNISGIGDTIFAAIAPYVTV